jgi:glutamate-5-semialdehyde dehydrogenase
MNESGLEATMERLGRDAVAAARRLARADTASRDRALHAAAAALRASTQTILDANQADLRAAHEAGLSAALLDRLALDAARIQAMAQGLQAVAEQPDPLGRLLAEWTRPNGLVIRRVTVPLGVIGIIYESRPNVTADAGALCLKSGNAAILRGGSDSARSSAAIFACLAEGLEQAGLPPCAIQMVPTQDREAVGYLLRDMARYVNVVVPRGGKGLIERVRRDARVPVIGHLEGNCHVYVHEAADLPMARAIVLNAKLRRTGVCGAAETLLVDRGCAATHLAPIVADLLAAGCEVRGDEQTRRVDSRVRAATEEDWYREYLDAIIAVRVVDGLDEAIRHIGRYGSAAGRFLAEVDSAIVLHNASTQFADGGEFGMGAEIGISTDRLHARGPVGLEQLVSYKYQVLGSGQLRPV